MHKICSINDIPCGEARSFIVEGKSIFIVNHHNDFYAYKNRCPHNRLELEWEEHQFLSRDGLHIQCANHGALFQIENGHCIAGPCSGFALTPFNIHISEQSIFAKII